MHDQLVCCFVSHQPCPSCHLSLMLKQLIELLWGVHLFRRSLNFLAFIYLHGTFSYIHSRSTSWASLCGLTTKNNFKMLSAV